MAENEKSTTISLAQLQIPTPTESITLLEAFGILWSRKLFLLACMILGALIGIGVGRRSETDWSPIRASSLRKARR